MSEVGSRGPAAQHGHSPALRLWAEATLSAGPPRLQRPQGAPQPPPCKPRPLPHTCSAHSHPFPSPGPPTSPATAPHPASPAAARGFREIPSQPLRAPRPTLCPHAPKATRPGPAPSNPRGHSPLPPSLHWAAPPPVPLRAWLSHSLHGTPARPAVPSGAVPLVIWVSVAPLRSQQTPLLPPPAQ